MVYLHVTGAAAIPCRYIGWSMRRYNGASLWNRKLGAKSLEYQMEKFDKMVRELLTDAN